MQISKLYETKITCSNYNPNIDDTITVTVALIDFNGNNVTGTNATITVNQGYFTKYTRNSSDTAISGTTTKSYTGTTGTDGTFTMTYKCSEWGLATFSANNSKIQSNIIGWKTPIDDTNYTVKYNNELVSVSIHIADNITYSPSSTTYSGAEILKDGDIDLRPPQMMTMPYGGNGAVVVINEQHYNFGRHRLTSFSGNITTGAYANFFYKKK